VQAADDPCVPRSLAVLTCVLCCAVQGKHAMVTHFQNSSLLHEDKRCRPILFHSEGPMAGEASLPLPWC
jgi:hypothetical protein